MVSGGNETQQQALSPPQLDLDLPSSPASSTSSWDPPITPEDYKRLYPSYLDLVSESSDSDYSEDDELDLAVLQLLFVEDIQTKKQEIKEQKLKEAARAKRRKRMKKYFPKSTRFASYKGKNSALMCQELRKELRKQKAQYKEMMNGLNEFKEMREAYKKEHEAHKKEMKRLKNLSFLTRDTRDMSEKQLKDYQQARKIMMARLDRS